MLEIWRAGGSNTGATRELAQTIEAEGWDGQMFMDSQCLSADPYVQMGVWASATERIKLSTGVTNPLTRNLAVTAGGAASVQAISNGRAVLGIGRGDSALAYLGHAPVGLRRFRKAIEQLQVLLSGGEISFDTYGISGDAPSIEALSLAGRPQGVRLKWLPEQIPKVPLDVAATGPKVIMMSAPVAERVTFSVGAEPDRLQWALDLGREARAEHGLGEEGISWGAQIIVVCHSRSDVAMDVAMQMAPPLARFQVMGGEAVGPNDQAAQTDLEKVRSGYDMNEHGNIESQTRLKDAALTPEFVSRFAVVGSPQTCLNRLLELKARGLQRFVIVGPGFYPESWGEARDLFVREVLPALKAG